MEKITFDKEKMLFNYLSAQLGYLSNLKRPLTAMESRQTINTEELVELMSWARVGLMSYMEGRATGLLLEKTRAKGVQ